MSDEVRKGITNAQFNENNSNILFAEIGIAAIAAGVYFQSWLWGGWGPARTYAIPFN